MPQSDADATTGDAAYDLVRFQERRLALCDALEALADDLPSLPDAQMLMALSRELMQIDDERARCALLIIAARQALPPAAAEAVAARLCRNFADDSFQAADLALELAELASAPTAPAAEQLGMSLRSFFTACRRTIATEALALLHAGRGRPDGYAAKGIIASLRK